jgi:hypothetical protein
MSCTLLGKVPAIHCAYPAAAHLKRYTDKKTVKSKVTIEIHKAV